MEELTTTSTTGKLFNLVQAQVGIHSQVKKELPTYVSPALANYQLEQGPSVKKEVDHASSASSGVY